MIKIIYSFIITASLITFLLISQTTVSNMLWLLSIDMPVTFSIIFSSLLHDLYNMNGGGAIPVIGLVSLGLFIAFLVSRVILVWVNINHKYAYALAGGCALAAIVLMMPLAFYNLDLIAGARSLYGKIYLIFSGILGGYLFGYLTKSKEG
ncbi:MAG: hypothetical protein P8J93_05655 [SAR86 cluster bacterium]|nr:hypothetical protein [SAR86 cluster bacterium]